MRLALLTIGACLAFAGGASADTVYQVPREVEAAMKKSCVMEKTPAAEMAECTRMGSQLYMAFYTCHYAHPPGGTWKCMQENVPGAIKYTDDHPRALMMERAKHHK